jgi:hypothetical protein
VAPQHPCTDRELADAFDALAKGAHALRQLMSRLTLTQLTLVAESAPWGNCGANTLLDLDTWGVAAAAGLRDVTGMVG